MSENKKLNKDFDGYNSTEEIKKIKRGLNKAIKESRNKPFVIKGGGIEEWVGEIEDTGFNCSYCEKEHGTKERIVREEEKKDVKINLYGGEPKSEIILGHPHCIRCGTVFHLKTLERRKK